MWWCTLNLALVDEYPEEHIYTDGSTYGLCILWKIPRQNIHLYSQNVCNKDCFDQNLETNNENGSYTTFSNSQSALISLKSRAGVPLICKVIKTIIHQAEAKNLRLHICGVPRHVGVVGKEKANIAAKEVTIKENSSTLGR